MFLRMGEMNHLTVSGFVEYVFKNGEINHLAESGLVEYVFKNPGDQTGIA